MKKIFVFLAAVLILCGCAETGGNEMRDGDPMGYGFPDIGAQSGQTSQAVPGSPGAAVSQEFSSGEVPESIIDYSLISTEIPQKNIHKGDDSFTVEWTNGNNVEFAFGVSFRLERKNGMQWEKVPFKDGANCFKSIAVLLPAGESTQLDYSLSRFEIADLTPGAYRWVYDFNNPNRPSSDGYYNDMLTAEFTIPDCKGTVTPN